MFDLLNACFLISFCQSSFWGDQNHSGPDLLDDLRCNCLSFRNLLLSHQLSVVVISFSLSKSSLCFPLGWAGSAANCILQASWLSGFQLDCPLGGLQESWGHGGERHPDPALFLCVCCNFGRGCVLPRNHSDWWALFQGTLLSPCIFGLHFAWTFLDGSLHPPHNFVTKSFSQVSSLELYELPVMEQLLTYKTPLIKGVSPF